MGIPCCRVSVRMMMIGVAVAATVAAIWAGIARQNETRLSCLVSDATLRAKYELGDLSEYTVTTRWTGDYSAQVVFHPKDEKKKKGRCYQVDSCCCGMKMKVTSSDRP
jgi:hypothetical protein